MKYLWLLLVVAVLGCEAQSQEATLTRNGINVEFLFEHDGIRMYRFQDGTAGPYVYFSKSGTTWNQSDGESSRPVMINH